MFHRVIDMQVIMNFFPLISRESFSGKPNTSHSSIQSASAAIENTFSLHPGFSPSQMIRSENDGEELAKAIEEAKAMEEEKKN